MDKSKRVFEIQAIRHFIIAGLLGVGSVHAETTWFVMSEIPPATHGDSYLLPLSDPAQIDMARQLLQNGVGGPVGSIASVQVAAGSDGFNRDVLADGAPLWSWHVTAFNAFTDFAIELCDGSPGIVENDVAGFLGNTGNVVCFWSYTVTAELDQPPTYRPTIADSGAWLNLETPGQGFLVEVLESAGQWFAAWFTYEAGSAKLGSPEQRWLTAQGPLADGVVTLDISSSSGGRFDAATDITTTTVGSLRLTFEHCNLMHAEYDLGEESGAFALERLVARPDCEPTGTEP